MFHDRSAWFSSSVPRSCHHFWTSEGGTVAGWRTADYLFSQDAACPDTLRIFESRDYLMDQVTVFHCLFLFACEKRQNVKSVCIGHYVLPPGSVQDEVRDMVGRLIWENEDEQSQAQISNMREDEESSKAEISGCSDQSDADSSEGEDSACGHLQDFSARDPLTGYVNVDELPRYSGDLCDFHPKCVRCSNCETCISADSH